MLDILLRASLEGGLLVAIIWLVVRALPALSPAARAALWWCAAAKFVVALVWTVPIEIAVLPASGATEVAPYRNGADVGATVGRHFSGASVGATVGRHFSGASVGATVGRHFSGANVGATEVAPYESGAGRRVETALVTAWCAGLVVALVLVARRWRRTAGVIRRASPAPTPVRAEVAALAARLALRRAPDVRISSEVETPLVAGFRRPGVLLPARFAALSPRHQRMALCHELTHIARGDLRLGYVPALAERLFFFHPLVHLAAREYLFWREAACDAAVIKTLEATPHEYGRLLLDLGIASPPASLAAAGASWSFSNLKRRIHMLGDIPRESRSGSRRTSAAAAVTLALCAIVPFRLVAREPVQSAPQPPQPPALSVPPAMPRPPSPTVPPARPEQASEARELAYVLFFADKGDERLNMSGSQADVERARGFRRGNEALLWFRDRRGEFVVRDPSVLREVEAAWKPVAELGAKQGRLGAEQGKLGSKMGELGTKQGLIGAEQGRLGAKQGALGAKQGELAAQGWKASEAQRAQIEKAHRDIERNMRALDEEMKALNGKMREFEKPMRELGAEMEALGTQMEALGRQLEKEVARARAELRSLLDRAVASGAAQAIK